MELNNKNTAIIVIVIMVIAIAAVGAYYFFIYDDSTTYNFKEVSFKSHDKSIVFNDTESNLTEGFSYYNGNKTTVKIFNLNKSSSAYALGCSLAINTMKKYPSETYKNRVIYTTTATIGEHVGEVRYISLIENNDKNIVVDISSDDKDEVVFIVDSLKILI